MSSAGAHTLPELSAGFDLAAEGEEFYRHYLGLALERVDQLGSIFTSE